jgi:hypothetical protein
MTFRLFRSDGFTLGAVALVTAAVACTAQDPHTPQPSGLRLIGEGELVLAGDTLSFFPVLLDSAGQLTSQPPDTISWAVSDSTVIALRSGRLVAVSPGSAVITATGGYAGGTWTTTRTLEVIPRESVPPLLWLHEFTHLGPLWPARWSPNEPSLHLVGAWSEVLTTALPAMSPDGRHLAIQTSRHQGFNADVMVLEPVSGAIRFNTDTLPGDHVSPRWLTPDVLLFSSNMGTGWEIWSVNLTDGQLHVRSPIRASDPVQFDVVPNATALIVRLRVSDSTEGLFLAPLDSAIRHEIVRGMVSVPRVDPSGRWLAYGSGGVVYVVPLPDGSPVALTQAVEIPANTAPAFTPRSGIAPVLVGGWTRDGELILVEAYTDPTLGEAAGNESITRFGKTYAIEAATGRRLRVSRRTGRDVQPTAY